MNIYTHYRNSGRWAGRVSDRAQKTPFSDRKSALFRPVENRNVLPGQTL